MLRGWGGMGAPETHTWPNGQRRPPVLLDSKVPPRAPRTASALGKHPSRQKAGRGLQGAGHPAPWNLGLWVPLRPDVAAAPSKTSRL